SGTVFRCIKDDPLTGAKADELVMSFRSTEFIDDAARDNMATNTLEIADTGIAWGQNRDMVNWYTALTEPGGVLAGQSFSVTGYSLGGHLATAFNLIYAAAKETVTFNGAGVGAYDPKANSLATLVRKFTDLSGSVSASGFKIFNCGRSMSACARPLRQARRYPRATNWR